MEDKHIESGEVTAPELDVTAEPTTDLTAEEELIVASAQAETPAQPETPEVPIEIAADAPSADDETAQPVSEETEPATKRKAKGKKNKLTEAMTEEIEKNKAKKAPKAEKKPGNSAKKETKPAHPTVVTAIPEADTSNTVRVSLIPDHNTASPSALVYVRIILAVAAVVIARVVDIQDTLISYFDVAAALIAGYDIIIAAVKDVIDKIYMRENLPLIIASVCSFAIGRSLEGAVAVILLQCSYILRGLIVKKIKSLELRSIAPPKSAKDIAVGDTMALSEGVCVPADSVVTEGRGMIDCSFLTGDISPVQFKGGDFIPAGCICLSGNLMIKIEALPEVGISAKISRTVDSGFSAVSPTEERMTAYARFCTPVLLFLSIVLLILLPFTYDFAFEEALRRIVTIIAISSPCAALLTIPMTYLTGMVSARRSGIVFSDTGLMDKTAEVRTVVFDKAGTVTNDAYIVSDLYSDRMEPGVFLKVAAHAAAVSGSTVFKAIVAAYGDKINFELVRDFIEYRGKGVSVVVDGIQILLGTGAFLVENGIELPTESKDGTTIHMTVQGVYAGRIVLKDSVNINMPEAITALKTNRVDRIAMISGDGREKDGIVAREAGINEYYAECSSEEKARRIKEIKSRTPEESALAYVGCGEYCEDACATADVGIILRGMENCFVGTSSKVAVMGRTVNSVPEAINRAARTKTIAKAKFFASMVVKLIIIILSISGASPLWFGLVLDYAVNLALIPDYTEFLRPKKQFQDEG